MKKIIFGLAILIVAGIGLTALTADTSHTTKYATDLLGATHSSASSLDSVTNAGTGDIIVATQNGWSALSFQATATKISGTVAGYALLQGSLDGVVYKDISTDTMGGGGAVAAAMANTTTNNKFWTGITDSYKYYRVHFVGTGTQLYTIKGKIVGISPLAFTK